MINKSKVFWSTYTIMIVVVILAAMFLQGCATINDNVVRGVNAYCNEAYADRQLTRAIINSALAETGHIIEVHCEGDPND